MGWQFVDEAEGERALEEGTFYATITIPDNFSKDNIYYYKLFR